jgi:Uma2 family endonuclease
MNALLAPFQPTADPLDLAGFRAFQEAHPTEKWQLVKGRIYAMTGGTARHATLIANLAFGLRRRFQGGPCRVLHSDMNVVDEVQGLSTYPDIVVRCGGAPLDQQREMTDPTAVFEVLSPSTRHLDQGAKLFAYQQIDSVVCIGLVYPEEMRVELWTRGSDGFAMRALKRPEDQIVWGDRTDGPTLIEVYEGVAVDP